jgi:hypothetical protein
VSAFCYSVCMFLFWLLNYKSWTSSCWNGDILFCCEVGNVLDILHERLSSKGFTAVAAWRHIFKILSYMLTVAHRSVMAIQALEYRLQHSTLRCSAGYVNAELKNFLLESFTDCLFYIPLLQAALTLSTNFRHHINKHEIWKERTLASRLGK